MNTPGTVLDFALPDLGEGLTEAEVVRWFVAVGDEVGVDQPVVEVETAKAVVEVPCPYAGVVTRLCGEPGTTLRVGTPLLSVAATGAPAATAAPADATPAADAPASGRGRGRGPAVRRLRPRPRRLRHRSAAPPARKGGRRRPGRPPGAGPGG
ncbi:biotin/lipoyl-containing protein, partial [Streptomyces roseolus]|uniref:biotin/lipoyl-containing protein n=1 Tax=Streptomyces roseolus TaxID=67358 RepID=UPI0036617EFF